MVDTLGYRRLYGVVTPSTNTVVQPEYDDMRPKGVTNHIARMHIPDDPVESDADFDELIRRIDVALEAAVDRVMTCRPQHLILGISAESIWGGGSAPSKKIAERIRVRAGDIPVTQAADAVPAALKAFGVKKRIGLVTPYFPTAEKHLKAFFDECGYEIAHAVHLSCTSPVLIAHVPRERLFMAMTEVNGPDVDAIVQFGANLPMGQVAADAEKIFGKPVIAVNTATYWHALRTGGIADKVEGVGRLMAEH